MCLLDCQQIPFLLGCVTAVGAPLGNTFLIIFSPFLFLPFFNCQGLLYGGNDTLYESTGLYGHVRYYPNLPPMLVCVLVHTYMLFG